MTAIRSQRSAVSSRKLGRDLTPSPLPFVLSLVGAMLLALRFSAEAQQPTKIPQIGLVVANRETTSAREFQQGLRELGYIERKNILFEYRYTQQNLDRIPSLVSELVQLKVDVLVVSNFRAIRAAKQATQTIPVVMVTTQDPVETGIIDSLADRADDSAECVGQSG